jgi:histidinol dehydrogenase
MIRILRHCDDTFAADLAALRELLRGGGLTSAGPAGADISATVAEIIAAVRRDGDAALIEHTARFDQARVTAETIRIPAETIAQAHRATDADFLALIGRAAENIRRYQEHIRIEAPPMLERAGRRLGVRYTPLDRVGVYVPGGKAVYPSTVLMTVVPAQVAGVGQIALLSPPTGGAVNPMVLATAAELGVEEIYGVSGTAGVAALAWGTQHVAPVDKIVGPGNAFIAEAKRQVLGRVGIDSIAGPSEVLIVADETARAEWIAADMCAQVEHDPGSAVLVTDSSALADAVRDALARQAAELDRGAAIRAGLERYSAILVAADMDGACELAAELATEHLLVMTADPSATLEKIPHAGAAFLGGTTPVPLGDYFAGPSHVLPTGGTAHFFSPLSVNDFRKATSIIEYSPAALDEAADDVIDFASREGLTAHAAAVRLRKDV